MLKLSLADIPMYDHARHSIPLAMCICRSFHSKYHKMLSVWVALGNQARLPVCFSRLFTIRVASVIATQGHCTTHPGHCATYPGYFATRLGHCATHIRVTLWTFLGSVSPIRKVWTLTPYRHPKCPLAFTERKGKFLHHLALSVQIQCFVHLGMDGGRKS